MDYWNLQPVPVIGDLQKIFFKECDYLILPLIIWRNPLHCQLLYSLHTVYLGQEKRATENNFMYKE